MIRHWIPKFYPFLLLTNNKKRKALYFVIRPSVQGKRKALYVVPPPGVGITSKCHCKTKYRTKSRHIEAQATKLRYSTCKNIKDPLGLVQGSRTHMPCVFILLCFRSFYPMLPLFSFFRGREEGGRHATPHRSPPHPTCHACESQG